MIDIVWAIPAAAVAMSVVCAYLLGVEVGRDRGRREEKARRRHPAGKSLPKSSNNVRFLPFITNNK